MPARKAYTAAEVEHLGVPAYHPKGFWYDPVAPKSGELGFFVAPRPQEALAPAPSAARVPQKGWRHYSDCWCELCRK